jgi:hypothetical protein
MNTLCSYITILLIEPLLSVNWFIHNVDESLSFKYIYKTKHPEHKNEPYRRQVYCVFVMAQLQAFENAKSPWRHRLDVLHNSYQDVRCRYCLIMWNEGEDSLSVVGKDLIYCHMISGPCPCKNRAVAFFFLSCKSCEIWKIVCYVDSLWNVRGRTNRKMNGFA